MSRPAISVVMPFAGTSAAAAAAMTALAALHTEDGDELLFVDNARAPVTGAPAAVTMIRGRRGTLARLRAERRRRARRE